MAFKSLTAEEMQPVSAAWVDTGDPAHQAILQVPELNGLLPQIELAHQGLHAAIPPDDSTAKEISNLAAETDSVHDTLARGIHGYLSEVALLVKDGEPLLKLRDELMPEGLAAVVRNTYRGQAGFAAILRSRLTDATRGRLRELPLPGGATLADAVDAWLAAGDRLGRLEAEKARLAAAVPTLAGRVFEARNRWIRVANAMVVNADLVDLTEERRRIIFGPLQDAEDKAEARQARRSAGDVGSGADATPSASTS